MQLLAVYIVHICLVNYIEFPNGRTLTVNLRTLKIEIVVTTHCSKPRSKICSKTTKLFCILKSQRD